LLLLLEHSSWALICRPCSFCMQMIYAKKCLAANKTGLDCATAESHSLKIPLHAIPLVPLYIPTPSLYSYPEPQAPTSTSSVLCLSLQSCQMSGHCLKLWTRLRPYFFLGGGGSGAGAGAGGTRLARSFLKYLLNILLSLHNEM